jgi:NAD(P)-dependent dehydrogenase (short-subunit alcohol dehydrogenase family)
MSDVDGLADKRILITGGGRAPTARLLASRGARVIVCDLSDEALDAPGLKTALVSRVHADVTSEQDVDRMFAIVEDKLGGLDALVNNAGITGPTAGIEEIPLEEWRRCLDVCLTSQFLCSRRAVPMLKAAGGGSIVNMSSAAGRYGYAYRTPYSSAKFGVIGLTQSLAKELGPAGIRVNAILPGFVEGERMTNVIRARAEQLGTSYDDMERQYLSRVSLRQMVTQDDVAATIAFLLSSAGRMLSGQSIGVDGNVETL